MEEIEIDLATLQQQKEDIQHKIYNLFKHNRWPRDDEFVSLKLMSEQLIIIHASIETLRSVQNAILINSKEA